MNEKGFTLFELLAAIAEIAVIAAIIAVGYTVIHFVQKFW